MAAVTKLLKEEASIEMVKEGGVFVQVDSKGGDVEKSKGKDGEPEK